MSTGPQDADLPVVPGLGPADGSPPRGRLDPALDPDRFDPARETPALDDPERDGFAVGGPAVFDRREHGPRILGAADDPDRFDPAADAAAAAAAPSSRRLDPAQDPDRFLPPGQGQTLTELLGQAGAHEEERDNYQWAIGLLCVLGFLALVAFLFQSVLTP